MCRGKRIGRDSGNTTLLLRVLAKAGLASLKQIPASHHRKCSPVRRSTSSTAMKETTVESQYFSSTISRIVEDSEIPLTSPPGIKTPPPASGNRIHANGNNKERAVSEAIDAGALSKALKDFEEAGRARERTPGGSPSRKRQRVYGDRSVALISFVVLETDLAATGIKFTSRI